MKVTLLSIFTLVLCLFSISAHAQQRNTDAGENEVNESRIVQLERSSSFNELIDQFRGKTVFVDIMASWCKTGLAELKEYRKMESFFAERNIVKLFISIDNPSDWQKCIDALEEHQVKGYFTTLHAPQGMDNTRFIAELSKFFFSVDNAGDVSLSVPHYMVIDKRGRVVVRNAKRPSDVKGLMEQLEKVR